MKKEAYVFIGVPLYPGGMVHSGTCQGLMHAMNTNRVTAQFIAGSFTTLSFNMLWCEAMNRRKDGITHFCMLHSDIDPEPEWLKKLLALSVKHQADIISAVIPIKTPDGLTSTAYQDGPNHLRRYTMREIYAMPEKTFTRKNLFLNNGMMLVSLANPWVERMMFDMRNEIKIEDGVRSANGLSEDWFFSQAAEKLGARQFATAEVRCEHVGGAVYPNSHGWGTMEHDQGIESVLE